MLSGLNVGRQTRYGGETPPLAQKTNGLAKTP
ncbi:unnamed protein product, partial [marine sediment metagenome]